MLQGPYHSHGESERRNVDEAAADQFCHPSFSTSCSVVKQVPAQLGLLMNWQKNKPYQTTSTWTEFSITSSRELCGVTPTREASVPRELCFTLRPSRQQTASPIWRPVSGLLMRERNATRSCLVFQLGRVSCQTVQAPGNTLVPDV